MEYPEDFSGDAAQYGDMIHKRIESFINAHIRFYPDVPESIQLYVQQVLDELPKDGHIVAEVKGAITKELEPCDWFDKNVWLRCILDVLHTKGQEAWIIDWKTGKVRPNSKQLKLFALFVMTTRPNINVCHTSFEWLAHSCSTKEVYTRDDLDDLWSEFVPDLKLYVQAFKTDTWPKKPSGLCKQYCNVMDCEYNGRRE